MIDGRRGRRKNGATPVKTRTERRSLGSRLVAFGIGANAVTTLGILLAAATGVLAAYGDFFAAVGLIIVGGLMDTLDGHVAKAAGTSSPRGAFFDSVADRIGDSVIFLGVAGYFARTHDGPAALAPLGVLAVANLVSYERAKAESLGFTAQGGVMERAERLIFLGVALFVAGFVPAALLPLLLVLVALVSATAVGRFVRVWRQASGRHPSELMSMRAFRERRRAWRDAHREEARRAARDLVPLSVRVRELLTSAERGAKRPDGAELRRRAHAFVRRMDADR